MKYILILIILFTANLSAQWYLQTPTPNRSTLNSITSNAAGTWFLAGDEGLILKSTDKGESWTDISIGLAVTLNDIYFYNDNYGFVAGNNGYVFKTTNGGKVWELKDLRTVSNMVKVCFPSPDHGFIIDNYNGAYALNETTNGGNSWTTRYAGIRDMQFFDQLNGIAYQRYDYPGDLVKTTDGGYSWQKVAALPAGTSQIEFIDRLIGYTAGSAVFKTTDGGLSWSNVLPQTARRVSFSDKLHGIMLTSSNSEVYCTTNGGTTWSAHNLYCSRYSVTVQMMDNDRIIYLCDGAILKSTNSGVNWLWVTRGSFNNLNALQTIDKNNIIAVGASGAILRTYDGGRKWYEIASNTAKDLYVVSFFDKWNGFAAGASGTLLKTTDGGNSWAKVAVSITSNILGLQHINSNTIYAGGNVFVKSTDGGITWASKQLPGNILDMDFIDAETGYAAIDDKIYKTTNGGETFNVCLTGSVNSSISFIDKDNGLLSNSNGVSKTTDGGASWNLIYDESSDFRKIKAWDSNNFSVIDKLSIHCSTDGGLSWTKQPLEGSYNNSLNNLIYTDASAIYTCGNNGHIYSSADVFTSVANQDNFIENNDFNLSQNYPNPFNPVTTISYSVKTSSFVKIIIYDALGSQRAVLVNELETPGQYQVHFDGKDFTSGVYFYRLEAGSYTETKKMLLLK